MATANLSSNLHEIELPPGWPNRSSWTDLLAEQLASPQFQQLTTRIELERRQCDVYPPTAEVFNALRLCSPRNVKVVILGQDPYHGPGQAHGLSFSVRSGIPLPPSLRNIFRELEDDLGIDRGENGDLTSWARQGVLLLNTVLTVRQNEANSHRGLGWEDLTDAIIGHLGQSDRSMVFVLWGRSAGRKRNLIGDQHCVIESAHPSPLSAYRGFFGSRPFSKINEALRKSGLGGFDWAA